MSDPMMHTTHIDGGSYWASWRGDTYVPYACASCGYRAEAVAFLEARGHSDGVGASPEAAERDAKNRAYEQLLGVVHAIPCPRCGHHEPGVLAQATEATRLNVRNARTRKLLSVLVAMLVLAAIALVVVAFATPLPWWIALIGVALVPVAVIFALVGIAYVPNSVPMVLPGIPPAVHFEEPRAALAVPFR